MKRTKAIKIFGIALVIIVVSTYGYTAAFSAGWFKSKPNPDLIYPTGYTIPFSVGRAAAYNGSVGSIWTFKYIRLNTPMVLSGSWNSSVMVKVLIIPCRNGTTKSNSSLIWSLLNSTAWSLGANINITLNPSIGPYELVFVPGPDETGVIKITREIIVSPVT